MLTEQAEQIEAPPPDPPCDRWAELLAAPPDGILLGRPQRDWRAQTRRELGLDPDRPIVATGHQTLLWHPGILAKYMLVDQYARHHDVATANLIVDQHVGSFGRVDVPIRRRDGILAERTIDLLDARPDVPMGLHEPVRPDRTPPWSDRSRPALPSVEQGYGSILDAIERHADAPNAARQMARVLAELMMRWCRPMADVTSSDLIGTTLARALLEAMARDPWTCIEHYNRAVRSLPEAGVATLLMHRETVELPVWRLDEDGRRRKAYSHHVEAFLDGDPIRLMPRALFMTALVRLGMCDLFIHGTGGANYDRTMERWMRDWLSVEVGAVGVCTATVRLPLEPCPDDPGDPAEAVAALRRLSHDPAIEGRSAPSREKQAWLEAIDALPRRSRRRREMYFAMHRWLDEQRGRHREAIDAARRRVERARRCASDAAIRGRRDWPFPLYPDEVIDTLSERIRSYVADPQPMSL